MLMSQVFWHFDGQRIGGSKCIRMTMSRTVLMLTFLYCMWMPSHMQLEEDLVLLAPTLHGLQR